MKRAAIFSFLALLLVSCGCRKSSERSVVLYTSQDQVFAEPILKRFTSETGIRVETVFDSEAVKTVGLANRLLVETNQPRCDVWWSNEEMRTRQLAARGVFASNKFVSFGFRSRRIVVNTNMLAIARAPASLFELTNASWSGKVAFAYPMFGTTSAHFSALREAWGPAVWESWCRAIAANKPFLVDGNSTVVKLVSRGEAWLGLTDSDDIIAAQREKAPITGLSLNAETLLIPNTIAIVAGAPHPSEAGSLVDYLQTAQVANSMIAAGAIEATNISSRPHLAPSWTAIVAHLDETTALMKGIFLR